MEYLCAGERHDVTGFIVLMYGRKIVVRKMTSNLESPFAAGNADTVSCIRREQSEVSSDHPLALFVLMVCNIVVQFEAR